MDLKIIVAAHKQYDIPKEDIYLPVFVGSALSNLSLCYQRDDEGENISAKNRTFCELTGLYWAYKNIRADYIGLCHYRRFLNLKNIEISDYDVILPKKRHYYIETVYDQFGHAHGYKALDIVREIIKKNHLEYLDAFDRCMSRRSLHIYNIFIMRYEFFLEYCQFLFDVLFQAEAELGEIDRIYGYLGERLLDVFLTTKKYKYIEVPVIEKEKANWPKKIYCFLKRKYLGDGIR